MGFIMKNVEISTNETDLWYMKSNTLSGVLYAIYSPILSQSHKQHLQCRNFYICYRLQSVEVSTLAKSDIKSMKNSNLFHYRNDLKNMKIYATVSSVEISTFAYILKVKFPCLENLDCISVEFLQCL